MNIALVLLFVGGVILTLGDIVMKKWVESNELTLFIIGMIVYLIGMVFLAFSFKYKNIAVASVIFVIFNVVTLSLVSFFYFKESLSLMEIGGILLGICAVVLLELS